MSISGFSQNTIINRFNQTFFEIKDEEKKALKYL